MKFTCQCCGFKTLNEEATGTYEICELCNWEDDSIQTENPDYEGGANGYSLREAQHFFIAEKLNAEIYEKDSGWVLLNSPSRESRLKNSKPNFVVDKSGRVKKS